MSDDRYLSAHSLIVWYRRYAGNWWKSQEHANTTPIANGQNQPGEDAIFLMSDRDDANAIRAGSADHSVRQMDQAPDGETPARAAPLAGAVANDVDTPLAGAAKTQLADAQHAGSAAGVPPATVMTGHWRRRPANVQVRRFVSRAITPFVLVVGLLILGFYQFNGVLKVTTAQDNAFHSVVAYNSGPMQVSFLQNAGTNRPSVNYKGQNLVTYVEWSSTIAVNGDVQELWNSYHGYSTDSQRQVIDSAASNDAWQIIQVITVVNASTVTVAYDFTYRPQANAPTPQHIELTILHQHSAWSQPTVAGDTFTGQITTATSATNASAGLRTVGTVTIALSGSALAPNPLRLLDYRSTVQANGQNQAVATALTSNYVLDHPVANVLIPLGVETITFSPAAPAK